MKPKFPTALVVVLAIVLIVGGLVAWKVYDTVTPGKYDKLAQCISDSGTKFYGAYWCVHCQKQKERFGKSAKLLPYVECATPGTSDLNPTCKEHGITGFPTWIGPDGWKEEREMELSELATKTGCELPK